MTDTIEPVELDEDEKQQIAQRLVDQAKEQGVDLVGPGGLLTGLTKSVLETALEEESPSTWDMTSTTRLAVTVRTRATGRGRRRS
jgi:hypothetical protein